MKRETDWFHMPKYDDGSYLVAFYCERCGSRNVFIDARIDLNTGQAFECGDGLSCDGCDDDRARLTDDRHEAAEARYNARRQEIDGCTCCCGYEPGEPATHAKHCAAAREEAAR